MSDAVPVSYETHCPTCHAPASAPPVYRCQRCGLASTYCTCADPIRTWRFDAERFLREKIAALTGEQLLKIARGVEQSGGLMMQWPSTLRAALRSVLLGVKPT